MATATAKKPNNALVVSVRNRQLALVATLSSSGDHVGAERALTTIADEIGGKEGDRALANALKKVPRGQLALILASTATKPTALVGGVIKPKDFVAALSELPKTWTAGANKDAKTQLDELFLGVMMRPDDDGVYGVGVKAFFNAIHQSPGDAVRILAWWLAQYDYDPEFATPDSDSEPEDGSDVSAGFDFANAMGYALEMHDGSWLQLVGLLRKHGLHETVVSQLGVKFESLIPSVLSSPAEADSLQESALGRSLDH